MLVPTAGPFFTRLPLEAAFKYQDRKRYISSRRYVAPSFNDVRLVLNSAQIMAVTGGTLQLATFDGDVTLYDDGQSLESTSPVIPRLLGMKHLQNFALLLFSSPLSSLILRRLTLPARQKRE